MLPGHYRNNNNYGTTMNPSLSNSIPPARSAVLDALFSDMENGRVNADLFTNDMTFWSNSSQRSSSLSEFHHAMQALRLISGHSGMHYSIKQAINQDARCVVEVESNCTLINDEDYQNQHVFVLNFNDDKIEHIAEYMNSDTVAKKINPLLIPLLQKDIGKN